MAIEQMEKESGYVYGVQVCMLQGDRYSFTVYVLLFTAVFFDAGTLMDNGPVAAPGHFDRLSLSQPFCGVFSSHSVRIYLFPSERRKTYRDSHFAQVHEKERKKNGLI